MQQAEEVGRGLNHIAPRRKRIGAAGMRAEAKIAFALVRGRGAQAQEGVRRVVAFHLPRRMRLRRIRFNRKLMAENLLDGIARQSAGPQQRGALTHETDNR